MGPRDFFWPLARAHAHHGAQSALSPSFLAFSSNSYKTLTLLVGLLCSPCSGLRRRGPGFSRFFFCLVVFPLSPSPPEWRGFCLLDVGGGEISLFLKNTGVSPRAPLSASFFSFVVLLGLLVHEELVPKDRPQWGDWS